MDENKINVTRERARGDSKNKLLLREQGDHVVASEREKVDREMSNDTSVTNERLSELIKQERIEADTRLLEERRRADNEALTSFRLLRDEKAQHQQTREDLTTRDEFLAIVSHDLRNPIGAISSCAEMLLEDVDYQNVAADLKQWITFIKRNADSALHLIRDLLDMERLIQGQLQLKQERHNLAQLVRESVEAFVHVASAKNILLRVNPAISVNDTIFCDRDRVQQVLSNLIGNALKFTPEGGSIVVHGMADAKGARITVTDTGPGIPEEKQKLIFNRFAQLGAKDRRGLGLGLYISKMLIEAHGGSVNVRSQVGEGSRFEIALPVQT